MRPHGARPPGDGDNSPHDGSAGPWDPLGNDPLSNVVIPDDARELDPDLRAWQREERWRRCWQRLGRAGLRRGRFGVGIPVALMALLAVSLLVSFAAGFNAMLKPNNSRHVARPQPLPLASSDVPVGQPGSLLPDVSVTIGGQTRAARDMRPGVVLLVEPDCDCDAAMRSIVGQAQAYQLPLYAVGQPQQHAPLAALVAGAGQAVPAVVDDPSGAFARAYAPQGLTAVLVAADGVVQATVRDVAPDTHLEAQLRPLVTAGATPEAGQDAAPLR